MVRNQNNEILSILKESRSVTGQNLELPSDLPITLPVENSRDLKIFEDYLIENKKFSSMVSSIMFPISLSDSIYSFKVSYFGTLGGRDVTSKTNTILKSLMSNTVAVDYSFLGTRHNKNSF